MYAMTPIIITRNMNVLVEYYIRPSNPSVTRGVEIALLGLTCEGSGGVHPAVGGVIMARIRVSGHNDEALTAPGTDMRK